MADEENTITTTEVAEEPEHRPLFIPDADDEEPAPVEEVAEEAQEDAEEVEEEAEEKPASGLERTWEDLQRRERELLQKEQQLSGAGRLLEALRKGDAKALRAAGIDTRELLRSEWGDDLLPDKQEPTTDERVAGLQKQLQEQQKAIAEARGDVAKYKLHGILSKQLAAHPEYEVASRMAADMGDDFFDECISYAVSVHQKTGKRPGWDDVLEHAENFYFDRALQLGGNVLKIPKVRAKLGLDVPQQATKPAAKPAAKPTLTSKMAATPARDSKEPLTEEEREAKTLEILKNAWVKDDEE